MEALAIPWSFAHPPFLLVCYYWLTWAHARRKRTTFAQHIRHSFTYVYNCIYIYIYKVLFECVKRCTSWSSKWLAVFFPWKPTLRHVWRCGKPFVDHNAYIYEHWPSTTCQNWACQIDRWCPVKTEKHKFLCDWSNDPPCRILVWDIRLFERFWSALPTPATICPFIYITEGVVLLLGDLRIYGYLWPKQSSNSSPQARKNGCRFFTSTSSLTGHCYGVWLAASQDRKRQKVMV